MIFLWLCLYAGFLFVTYTFCLYRQFYVTRLNYIVTTFFSLSNKFIFRSIIVVWTAGFNRLPFFKKIIFVWHFKYKTLCLTSLHAFYLNCYLSFAKYFSVYVKKVSNNTFFNLILGWLVKNFSFIKNFIKFVRVKLLCSFAETFFVWVPEDVRAKYLKSFKFLPDLTIEPEWEKFFSEKNNYDWNFLKIMFIFNVYKFSFFPTWKEIHTPFKWNWIFVDRTPPFVRSIYQNIFTYGASIRLYDNTKSYFYTYLSPVYTFFKNLIVPGLLACACLLVLIDYFSINFIKQLSIWLVIGLLFFWLISGFNFFVKRYKYGKFTSSLQRFWKRTNVYFWVLEAFLFVLFFYYYINSAQEPIYMFDESNLNQQYLPNLFLVYQTYLILILLFFYSSFVLLNLTAFTFQQNIKHLFLLTVFYTYIYLLESYQLFYVLTSFFENILTFDPECNSWVVESESPRIRVKQQYLLIALVVKYWHFLFIYVCWLFFVLKSYEKKHITFVLFGANIQNILILFWLNMLFNLQWIGWVLKRYVEFPYYWFFTNINEWCLTDFIFAFVLSSVLTLLFKNTKLAKNLYIIKQLIKKYLYTVNHKRLGLNYFYFSLVTGMSGALLATAIRIEMAYPGSPFFGGDSLKYLQVITAHALIMIFFVVVPIFFGGFANFLLPYHVGSKDVAFPRLNSLGFWIQPCGFLLIAKIGFLRTLCWTNYDKTANYFAAREADHFLSNVSVSEVQNVESNVGSYSFSKLETVEDKMWQTFFDLTFLNSLFNYSNITSWKLFFWKYVYSFPDAFWFLVVNAKYLKRQKRHIVKCTSSTQTVAGWAFITPFSSKVKFTGVGVQDMLILGVYFAGISTTISLVNLLATRRTLSIPGLRNRRVLLPFITITILLMLRALTVITPVLGTAMLMLAFDRHWQTSFFDFAYGGDPVFFHHLFWFFGHPEVYVLVIPAFGIINSVIPTVNFRRVASKHHLIWAIYIMNYMGFLVWGHHMYLIGLDHRSRALYSTITIMISMPATIKVVNWTFTLVNGALKNDLIFLSVISFILFFLVAGFTGMWLSHVSLNISMHDTLYVVAHFHLMLSGAVIMSIFVGFYFYFPNFFQTKYSRTFGYVHIVLYSGGQWATFLPLFWVSFSGLPRRLHDFPAIYMGWQSVATTGHFITMLGVLAFYFMILDSKVEKKCIAYLHTLVARFNKRCMYYIGKIIHLYLFRSSYSFVPAEKTQRLLYTLYGWYFYNL